MFVRLSMTGIIKPVCSKAGQGFRRICKKRRHIYTDGARLTAAAGLHSVYNETNELVIISCMRCSYYGMARPQVADGGTASYEE
jgi:hypothetical protein